MASGETALKEMAAGFSIGLQRQELERVVQPDQLFCEASVDSC